MMYYRKIFSLKIFILLLLFTSSLVSFTGHSAALDYKFFAILINIIHIISINIWFGTLLFIIINYSNNNSLKRILSKFTYIASVCMFLIILSGCILSLLNLDFSFPALLGTKYGYIILFKLSFLSLILFSAFLIKFLYLKHSKNINSLKIIKIEACLAITVFILGIILSQTVPGAHDEISWPLNFRISTEVAFENYQNLKIIKYLTFTFFIVTGIIITDYIFNKNLKRFVLILSLLTVTILPISIKILSVEAYPVTYKTPSVPYSAISVFNGKILYLDNCTQCHGKSGHGDGILADQLTNWPPANLTEPHTAYHTAGDIYWWLTFGKPPSSMPGFLDVLTEDERWDIINYLRTLSAGYEARLISDKVIKNKPWLPSIDFDYVTLNKKTGRLSKYRFNSSVMLIFFNINQSNFNRIININKLYMNYFNTNTKVILVPYLQTENIQNFKILNDFIIKNKILFPVIYEGAKEITETYKLYRRTLEKPDKYDENENFNYMEILIDKFGYVRSRWLLSDNRTLARNKVYFEMLKELFFEKQVLPPPDEHVH